MSGPKIEGVKDDFDFLTVIKQKQKGEILSKNSRDNEGVLVKEKKQRK